VRKAILDTDILSEIFKERNGTVLARAEKYQRHHDNLIFMSVSSSELLFGLYLKDAKGQIAKAQQFLKAHEEIVPTSHDYWFVAEINAALRLAGKPIGDADSMIAACAINRSLPIATGNTRHYQFVIDAGFPIDLENWRNI